MIMDSSAGLSPGSTGMQHQVHPISPTSVPVPATLRVPGLDHVTGVSRLPSGIDLSNITSILCGDGILYVEAPLAGFTPPGDIIIPIQVRKET